MTKPTRFLGLDVHADTITAAVAEADGSVRTLGTIANRPDAIRRLMGKLEPTATLKACYEAGAFGYTLYWQLTALGVACEVIAPTLIPVKPGDRVKTDRRDAERLARSYRSGDLTAVWVPDAEHEALRDLVRAREVAKQDQLRARHRLQKFLLRRGQRPPDGGRGWTVRYRRWLDTVRFTLFAESATFIDYLAEVDHATARVQRLEQALDAALTQAPARLQALVAALQALRGVSRLAATTIASEVGSLTRFARPRQLMGYSGLVAREASSGGKVRRGGITKTGNAHLRRIVLEAAWAYHHRPAIGQVHRRRLAGLPLPIREIAWKAQHRLHARYWRLASRGKPRPQVITAVGRELLGFIWAIGRAVEAA
jgi:transposase